MKLRHKKTGEIVTLKDEGEIALLKLIENSLPNGLSLWEEVKEPLIKDENIRKAVRAWADNLRDAMCDGAITFYVDTAFCTFQTSVWKGHDTRDVTDSDIAELDLVMDYDGLEDSVTYTIDELCGEEEE